MYLRYILYIYHCEIKEPKEKILGVVNLPGFVFLIVGTVPVTKIK